MLHLNACSLVHYYYYFLIHKAWIHHVCIYLYVQIQEVRLRLNVDVTVSPDSLPAPAPIESFVDMVRIMRSIF